MKKIGILGTGMVGNTVGTKLIELGYEVKGDITWARGTEMMLPIWVRLMVTTNYPQFGFKIVR